MGKIVEVLKANKGKVIAAVSGVIAAAGGVLVTVLIKKKLGEEADPNEPIEAEFEEADEENSNE